MQDLYADTEGNFHTSTERDADQHTKGNEHANLDAEADEHTDEYAAANQYARVWYVRAAKDTSADTHELPDGRADTDRCVSAYEHTNQYARV